MRKALTAATLAATMFVASACGTTDEPVAEPPTEAGTHNSADVKFAQMMIPHHEQAIEMAGMARTRAESDEVKEVAAAIEGAQDPEIKQMRGWLKAWGEEESSSDMGHEMPGIMDEETMTGLENAQGAEFDRKFLESMIEHHEGAIEMAKDEQADGKYTPAIAMADDIIKGQSAEIAQMRKMLEG
jgi:uncharacterized protein (DUF305 family)